MMNYKYLGTIVAPRGYNGEMKVSDLQFGLISINENTKVRIGYSLNFSREFTLKKWRQTNKSAKVELLGIRSDKDVYDLIESGIFVNEDDISDNKNPIISSHKLIGYKAFNYDNDDLYGIVEDVIDNPAHPILMINNSKSLIPIPNVKEFVKMTDNAKQAIYIKILDGLDDLGF